MKIILADSPSWRLFNPQMHLHLGILYLAGSLRAAGFDVKVVDCHRVTSWDKEHDRLVIHQELLEPCDVLGLSATTANVNYGTALAVAWPAAVKVLGGPHVNHIIEGPHERFKQKKYFENFDYLLVGECEESFVKFCQAVQGRIRPEQAAVPGLVWWDALGRHFLPPPTTPDVTTLPGPAFDLWQSGFAKGGISAASHKNQLDGNDLLTASLYTARGCPYGCTFCADARTKLREETTAQIEKEADDLQALGVQAVRIQDDTFTIRERRACEIADVLARRAFLFRATTRVNLRDPKLFAHLAKSGCTELGFGIEHGSARMLRRMQKGTTPEANELGVKMCQDAGIRARAFLMIGFPGETLETIEEMVEWVLRVRPDMVTLSLFTPYPGSDVWNHPEKYDVSLPDAPFDCFWQLGMDDDPRALVLDLPSISKEELIKARRELVKLFEVEIGSLDRTRLHGNVGTFDKRFEHP